MALTIPLQSPHSPLHMHAQMQPTNRLSARYINNKPTTITTTPNTNSRRSPAKLGNSKLICSCEQNSEPPSSADSIKQPTKRLITTRNAATSPNLDLRRPDNKILRSSKNQKILLEPCKQKPQKLLRNTRSLSPQVSVNSHSHSAQTSPNKLHTFRYSASNKSTDCLPKISMDPWKRQGELENSDPWVKREHYGKKNKFRQSAPSSPNFLSVSTSFASAYSLAATPAGSPALNAKRPQPLGNGLTTARHSFTTLEVEQVESELQLNIRRLSEQMRITENTENKIQLSASERNISQPLNVSIIQLNSGGADFSEYLQQQFQCQSFKRRISAGVKDDNLLETTC